MKKLRFSLSRVAAATTVALVAACGGDDTNTIPLGDSGGDVSLPDGNGGGDAGLDSGTDTNTSADTSDSSLPPTIYSHLFNGPVKALLHDGTSWYVGGGFYGANVAAAPHLLPIDSKGAQVTSCALKGGFDGNVIAALAVGGSVYVGGSFRHYQGAVANRVAKLDATTCALDTTFSPANNGFDGNVTALATSGTSLYLGGQFNAYKGVAGSANRLAKLDLTSGALDTTFSPANVNGFNNIVLALHVNGTSLYVGGQFNMYKGVGGSALRLAKLDLTSGAIDTTFSTMGLNGFQQGFVRALTSSGTSLYVGGQFNAYRAVPNSANELAKLDLTTGVLDTTFSPIGATANGFNGGVYGLAANGASLYVGGSFTAYKGVATSANHLAKLDLTSGAIDTTFSPVGATTNGTDGLVVALANSGTSLIVGGQFANYRGASGSAHNIAKLDLTSGAQDATFVAPNNTVNGFEARVISLNVAGNTIWAGGTFSTYGGYAANSIAKLDDTTWALDTVFSPANANGFETDVNALLVANKSLFVAGGFTAYRGAADSASRIAKLDLASGALDTTFSPPGANANGFDVTAHALATAGTSVYVGGIFTSYKGVANSANFVAKLDFTSGAIDTTFSPAGAATNGFDLDVFALAASSTSLYVGGDFNGYKGVANSAIRLAKLDLTTGALDATFSPPNANGFDAAVEALTLAGNVLYVGGAFNGYQNVPNSANMLAKLDATTGALDATFSPLGANANGFDNDVFSIAVVGNNVYCVGAFVSYRGVVASANYIAKLDAMNGAIDTTFSPVGALTNGFENDMSVVTTLGPSLFVGGRSYRYRDGSNGFGGAMAILDPTSGALK